MCTGDTYLEPDGDDICGVDTAPVGWALLSVEIEDEADAEDTRLGSN